MTAEPAELLKSALALPPETRAALVDSLLESLEADAGGLDADNGVEEAFGGP